MRQQGLIIAICIWAVTWIGCSIKNSYYIPAEKKSIILAEPFEFNVASFLGEKKHKLLSGTYLCYFADEKGDYYEAPSTMREGYVFNGKKKGGIFISKTDPPEAFLYFQDNEIYSYSYGQSGGSGNFKIDCKIPNIFMDRIKIIIEK